MRYSYGCELKFIIPHFKEVVDGIEYDSEQVVVYCDEVMEQVIIREFHESCYRQHKQLGINNFFYIQNDVLINLIIGDELGMKEGDC